MWQKALIAAGLWLVASGNALAQTRAVEDDQELLNWYYASTYGTGIYSAGDRTVAILQAPLSFPVRESNDQQWGMRITLPVSFGFYDFDLEDVVENGLPARINTLSIVPGIEFEKRVIPRWLLRPYISAGWGWELGGDESALIYDTGLRSRFRLSDDQGTVFSLVNWLSIAGYEPSGGPREPLGMFAIGVDTEIPTGKTLFDRPVVLSIVPTYYYYFSRLDFAEVDNRDNKIRDQWELALSLLARKPYRVLDIEVDRIGIAVRKTSDLVGFRIFTSLPF